jgi:hypothetical protein
MGCKNQLFLTGDLDSATLHRRLVKEKQPGTPGNMLLVITKPTKMAIQNQPFDGNTMGYTCAYYIYIRIYIYMHIPIFHFHFLA